MGDKMASFNQACLVTAATLTLTTIVAGLLSLVLSVQLSYLIVSPIAMILFLRNIVKIDDHQKRWNNRQEYNTFMMFFLPVCVIGMYFFSHLLVEIYYTLKATPINSQVQYALSALYTVTYFQLLRKEYSWSKTLRHFIFGDK